MWKASVIMKRHSGTEHRSNPDPEPEVTYRDKRVAILVQFQKTPNQIIKDLQPQAPSKAMVYKCIQRFRSGHYDLEDDEREGRLPSVIVPETIHAMKELMDQDRWFTVRKIHQTLQISTGTLLTIINDYLGLGKVSARCVPHQLKHNHMTARVRFCEFTLLKFDQGTEILFQTSLLVTKHGFTSKVQKQKSKASTRSLMTTTFLLNSDRKTVWVKPWWQCFPVETAFLWSSLPLKSHSHIRLVCTQLY